MKIGIKGDQTVRLFHCQQRAQTLTKEEKKDRGEQTHILISFLLSRLD